MKNKKLILGLIFITSLLFSLYYSKDLRLYYLVKKGNDNYYSKNYDKATINYEKALKIKEDPSIRINRVLANYARKEYQKVLDSDLDLHFIKANSQVRLAETKPEEIMKEYSQALEMYKEAILEDDDVNIKKNYEIISNKLKEKEDQKQNQDNKDNKENNENQEEKNNEENQQDKNEDKQDNSNDSKDNQDKENKKNQSNNNKQNEQNKNNEDKQTESEQKEKELQAVLMRLENNEKQSFKNNERLMGVGDNDSESNW